MKNAAEYTQRIRKLFSELKKEGSKDLALETIEDPMDQLLLGILSNYASESRAQAALQKLKEAMVDLNELRVTPVAEIVQIIGTSYPQCRPAAEEISAALGALFNRTHELSLSFLKQWPRKATNAFLDDLGILSPHTKAALVFRCLGGHAVPLDAAMFRYLLKADCIPEDADVEKAQKFLATRIKEREAMEFYVLFKKFAASHAPRRTPTKAKKAKTKRVSRKAEAKVAAAVEESEAKTPEPAVSARRVATTKRTAKKTTTKKKSAPAKRTTTKTARKTSSKTKTKTKTKAKTTKRKS